MSSCEAAPPAKSTKREPVQINRTNTQCSGRNTWKNEAQRGQATPPRLREGGVETLPQKAPLGTERERKANAVRSKEGERQRTRTRRLRTRSAGPQKVLRAGSAGALEPLTRKCVVKQSPTCAMTKRQRCATALSARGFYCRALAAVTIFASGKAQFASVQSQCTT